ncbi:MAG: hypothetical protein WA823_06125 [Candidatus Acidiferrales bacterium]
MVWVPLLGGAPASAQYNPLPSPIAEQEVAAPAQAAVQAAQNHSAALSQNPYLGGVPTGELSATPVRLSLNDAVAPRSGVETRGGAPEATTQNATGYRGTQDVQSVVRSAVVSLAARAIVHN